MRIENYRIIYINTIFHTKQYEKQLSEWWGNENVLSSAWQMLNCAFPWYVRLIAQSFKQRNAMFHVERKRKKSDVVESVYVLALRKIEYVRRDSIKNSDVSRGTVQKATVWSWMNAFYCDASLSFIDSFSARRFRCMRYTGLATMLLWPIAQKFIES